MSDEAKDFITLLLTTDPRKRPTAEQAMEHPWLHSAKTNRGYALREKQGGLWDFFADGDKEPEMEHQVQTTVDSAKLAFTNIQLTNNSKLQGAVRTFVATHLLLAKDKETIDEIFRQIGECQYRG